MTDYPTQADYPALVADLLVQQARVKATAVKSAFAVQAGQAQGQDAASGRLPTALHPAHLQG